MTSSDQAISALILSLLELKGVGRKSVQKLLRKNTESIIGRTTFSEQFLIDLDDNAILKGLSSLDYSWSILFTNKLNVIEKSLSEGIVILHLLMDNYPFRLRELENQAPILFCKGDTKLLEASKSVAVIGTRQPTEFGFNMARRLSYLLSLDDYVIVSGLALGSDSAGHLGALDGTGKTIAILPTGLNTAIFPPENASLANMIVERGGLLITEYEPYKQVQGRQLVSNLIARDEWQVGLSDGIIVVETGEHGGTHYAIQQAIKVKKPIGVFDYSSRLNQGFYTDKRFIGNVKFMSDGSAFAIFSKESVEHFKEIMEKRARQ